MDRSRPNLPPDFAPTYPNYPVHLQLLRIVNAPPSGTNLYPAYTQQVTAAEVTRDAEQCFVWEPNGTQLGAGYVLARLVGNHASLPLYVTTCCPSAPFPSPSSSQSPSPCGIRCYETMQNSSRISFLTIYENQVRIESCVTLVTFPVPEGVRFFPGRNLPTVTTLDFGVLSLVGNYVEIGIRGNCQEWPFFYSITGYINFFFSPIGVATWEMFLVDISGNTIATIALPGSTFSAGSLGRLVMTDDGLNVTLALYSRDTGLLITSITAATLDNATAEGVQHIVSAGCGSALEELTVRCAGVLTWYDTFTGSNGTHLVDHTPEIGCGGSGSSHTPPPNPGWYCMVGPPVTSSSAAPPPASSSAPPVTSSSAAPPPLPSSSAGPSVWVFNECLSPPCNFDPPLAGLYRIEAWGGGGGGGAGLDTFAVAGGAGGGAGGYGMSEVLLILGDVINIMSIGVGGAGGVGGGGSGGGAAQFTEVLVNGSIPATTGSGGGGGSLGGGVGGTGGVSTGANVASAGGAGFAPGNAFEDHDGGGGGASGGMTGNGADATATAGAVSTTGGANGGNGATGAATGSAGQTPGAGGGGGGGINGIGGAGGNGRVKITFLG